ncbi:Neurotransmitter-gated ion-channel ligand binding domain [Popillia japonica]|uniref:Neurotransmitter-gated ion-channel ligand binding domain n=1 Tax=Popillia japonica TaxID=7064 RepID=A0AAW1JHJ2_POPJA
MNVHIFLFLLAIFGVPSNCDITDCEMSSKQIHYHLRNDLLCDYYYDVRPKMDHRNATKVLVRMILQSFTYDMYSNTITVNSWMQMTWTDDHLKWPVDSYDNIDLIHLSSTEIWTPDIALYNKLHHTSVNRLFENGVDCIVRNTGKVTCVPPNQLEAICSADLTNYPYDKQKCVLRLGSWVHSGEEIDFRFANKPVTMDTVPNGEWDLVNVTVDRHNGNYSCCPNNTYPSLAYIFTIQRRPSYHEATLITPAIVIIIISLFIFSLDVAENERFYLIIVSLLFHLLYIDNLSWELPKVGNVPNIVLFARDSLILCLVQFMLTVTLRHMIKASGNNSGWISSVVGTLVQSKVGQVMLVFDNTVKAVAIAKGDEDGANIIEKSTMENNLDYISAFVNNWVNAIYIFENKFSNN